MNALRVLVVFCSLTLALVQSAKERNRQICIEIAGMNNQLNSNGRNMQSVKEVRAFLESKSN